VFFIPVFVLCYAMLGECTLQHHERPLTQVGCAEAIELARRLVMTQPNIWFGGDCHKVPTHNYVLSSKELFMLKKRLSPGLTK